MVLARLALSNLLTRKVRTALTVAAIALSVSLVVSVTSGYASLEAAVFGQYARHVRERHPGAPTPGFYRADQLFGDAQRLRASMGDTVFFARLSEASAGDGGHGFGSAR